MKIIVLTQYFPPETGAPQNRLLTLCNNLVELGAQVEVLTAMPNYPKMQIYPAYKGEIYSFEKEFRKLLLCLRKLNLMPN
jgi:hypothetical protein